MITFQLATLKPSDYRLTFTAKTCREGLKRMWQTFDKLGQDVALYAYYKGKWLKLTDTSVYRSNYEKVKITNYSAVFLQGSRC